MNRARWAVWGLAAVVASAVAVTSRAAPETASATFTVGAPLRGTVLSLPEGVTDAARAGDWTTAGVALRAMSLDALPGAQKSDWAFLVGWAAIHGDHPESAADVLPLLDGAVNVPRPYLYLVRGELLLGAGKPLEAVEWLEKVDSESIVAARARMRAADALTALGRTQDARAELEPLEGRPDPTPGQAEILLRLAQLRGLGSPEAAPLLRRIWTEYPGSEPDRVATTELAKSATPATWEQHAKRAERWMEAGDYVSALSEVQPFADRASGPPSLDACRLQFVEGRSLYKRNAVSDAAAALADIGPSCKGAEVDYGPRGLYLLGTALYRRKNYEGSAAAYRQIVDLYPDHSMADDALTRGGIALFEAGRTDDARRWWEESLATYPAGDTVPEALLRLSMSQYSGGDAAAARATAKKLGALPLAGDQVSVQAGRYWAARWRLYGDAATPSRRSADPSAVADAVAEWKALCTELPHSFYAILAWSRLAEVAPDVAAALQVRPPEHQPGGGDPGWVVRLDLAKDPRMRDGVALMRLGLANEAMAEIRASEVGELTPDERGWLSELRIASGDWIAAHDELRKWLGSRPFGTLGPREAELLRVAYPDRYWEGVQRSVKPTYVYEPRLFHALVREESSFDRKIVSFAGAYGLSQLMPATAQQTAGWLGMKVTNSELFEPDTNLPIGAKYLDAMHRQLTGSPYLALAAYNGGAHNVNKWVSEDGNPPTDEYVERIPYEETRGYVKRVMGTWQVMRYRFDVDRPAFPDLSKFNHQAKPEGP
ncbi:MAG: transglycosylase SLT domain-containing protein [Myxococcota bacterium]